VWPDSDLVGCSFEACRWERDYAARLGKPILPLALERVPPGLFPAEIARIRVSDFIRPYEAAALKLAGAIFAYPQGMALPNPLPASPEIPQTRFSDLNDLARKRTLTRDEQLGILVRLEHALCPSIHPDDRQSAGEMLGIMAQQQDLYEQAHARSGGRRARQKPPPKTPPPETPPSQPRSTVMPTAVNVNVHWGMAITTAVITFITFLLASVGIATLIYYNRARAKPDARGYHWCTEGILARCGGLLAGGSNMG
jgi:hypothetical protein